MTHLTTDEFMRLEALRLAIQAGDPWLSQNFYDFLSGKEARSPRPITGAVGETFNVS
ncbi:hypothetical protein WG907_05080 [Sphingobium sp. AN558]|uniref:hypothetical protein n=1 Tax=Sphingobium sp. AN558 TaxID=3133442 RepID=UPI0030C30C9B